MWVPSVCTCESPFWTKCNPRSIVLVRCIHENCLPLCAYVRVWVYLCVFFVCDSENGLKYVYIIKHSVLCCCFRYFFSILSFNALHWYVEKKEKWNQIVWMVGCLMLMAPFKSIEKVQWNWMKTAITIRQIQNTYAPVTDSFSFIANIANSLRNFVENEFQFQLLTMWLLDRHMA